MEGRGHYHNNYVSSTIFTLTEILKSGRADKMARLIKKDTYQIRLEA